MYKSIFITLISFVFTTSIYANEEDIIKSDITEVTVYAKGAQIKRKASYSIKSGVTKVIIDGVSPNIDPNSLQVIASGNSVIIIDSKYSLFYPKPEVIKLEGLPLKVRLDISKLEDSLKQINYEIQQIQDNIDVYTATKNILSNNGSMKGQGKVNDSIQLLKQAIDFYMSKMLELNQNLTIQKKKHADKSEVRNEMNARLSKLKNFQNDAKLHPKPKGPSHRITVTLSSTAAATGKMIVSYLVSEAGWTPLYDMRADVTSGNINMNYKAQVYQNSGEDWENIKLNISTNNPFQNKTLPTMHPWYITYNNYQLQQKELDYKRKNLEISRNNNVNYGNVPRPVTEAIEDAVYTNNSGVAYNAKTTADFTTVVDHMISAEFQIDLPYDIKSNNEQHMVLIKNMNIPAQYRYYTIPKLDQQAYLIAELTNLSDLQLVPAQANIFFDGSYIGETYLNPSQLDDTVNFSLGKDPNIIVRRTLMKDECKERIVGSNKEQTKAYNIEIRNLKSAPVEIIVLDQIPITTNPEIEIIVLDKDRAMHTEKSGNLEWKLKIKPKEKENINFRYRVKHNKDMQIFL
ncbi:MAG: mucoidy inhibitor MuiA family protein [Crocinitomicaceae bacterium]|nr:mucoidy inhibitor MuiA family protein [Crocinitomicaceae bacterium]